MSSSVYASVETQPDGTAPRWLEWAVASRPRSGESVSGDAAHVEVAGGRALVVAVDGLGHGPAAADAADRAIAAVRGRAGDDVDAVVERCHEALRGTRGAALGVAALTGETLTWAGVGNVEGWVFDRGRAPSSLLARPGIVGEALPSRQAATRTLQRGDVLVLTSDGIASAFADEFRSGGAPQAIADRILREHGRDADDAVVVVVRYLGDPR